MIRLVEKEVGGEREMKEGEWALVMLLLNEEEENNGDGDVVVEGEEKGGMRVEWWAAVEEGSGGAVLQKEWGDVVLLALEVNRKGDNGGGWTVVENVRGGGLFDGVGGREFAGGE